MDANLSDEIFESVKARFAAADEKSRAIIQEYINGGYKKTLEKLQMYLDGTNRTDPEIICEAGTVLKKSGYYGKTLANDVIENMSDAEYAVYTEHKNEFFENITDFGPFADYFDAISLICNRHHLTGKTIFIRRRLGNGDNHLSYCRQAIIQDFVAEV